MRKKIESILRSVMPDYIVDKLRPIRDYIWLREWRKETTKSFGIKNPDIYFYVIRLEPSDGGRGGMFAHYLIVLRHIIIALERNMIPIIDMENYKTSYSEDCLINNTNNAWEYYFTQPWSYPLSEVYESKNVLLTGRYPPNNTVIDSLLAGLYTDIETIKQVNAVIEKYMRFNAITEAYIDKHVLSVLAGKRNVLGVSSRGTDYVKFRPKGHSIQPDLDCLLEITRQKADEWNVDCIYIATEEAEALENFKCAFPGKILATDSFRHAKYDSSLMITEVRFDRENDKYLSGLEYIRDIVLLSRCDYFLGTLTSGASAAILMNSGKYKDKFVIDLGVYP